MYERNAIVIERYFNKIFKFEEPCNLRKNYTNFRDLVGKTEELQSVTKAEDEATEKFNNTVKKVKKVQSGIEKYYNINTKLEYNRYIIVQNAEEKTETLERQLKKTHEDIEKNIQNLDALDEEFVKVADEYKKNKEILENIQKQNDEVRDAFDDLLDETEDVFDGILEDDINFANDFVNSDNKDMKKELTEILINNGINEKIPFDNDVISNAVDVSFDIYKREIEVYLVAYEKTKKYLDEVDSEEEIKTDKYRKPVNDGNVKLDFLSSEKDYIVGFLDNERIAAIYDKKSHRKLMLTACKNLTADLEHINNIYEIILKEIAGRSTKKLYKENYDRDYLSNMEKSSEGAQEENTKIKTNALAVMNLNYWRIDGISKVEETFEKDIKEVYGKDVDEILGVKVNKVTTKKEETPLASGTVDENGNLKMNADEIDEYQKIFTESIEVPKEEKAKERAIRRQARRNARIRKVAKLESLKDDEEAEKENKKAKKTEEEKDAKTGEKNNSKTVKPKYPKLKSSKKALEFAIMGLKKDITEVNSSKEDNEEEADEKVENKSSSKPMKKWSFEVSDDEKKEEADPSENDEYAGLFEKISMLDELDKDDNTSKIKAEEFSNRIQEAAESKINNVFAKIPVKENLSGKGFSKFDDGGDEEVIDFYFEQSDKSEKRRKLHDEKQLNKDYKQGFFSKLMKGKK